MFNDEQDVYVRLASMYGAARLSTLCATRAERRRVLRMTQEGSLALHPNSVVSLPSSDSEVVMCRRIDGVMTCAHAMRHYGLPLRYEPGVLHVAVPGKRGRIPDGIGRTIIHRVNGLISSNHALVAEFEQALICYMRCTEELDALIALDAALAQGRVSADQLRAALGGRRNAPLRRLLERAHPEARSVLETIARYDLEEAGYRPIAAVLVKGIGEVDLLLAAREEDVIPGRQPGTRLLRPEAAPALIIETDGYTYHSSRTAWEQDHRRDQVSTICGHTTVRLTGEQVKARTVVEIVAPVASRMGILPDRCGGLSAPSRHRLHAYPEVST